MGQPYRLARHRRPERSTRLLPLPRRTQTSLRRLLPAKAFSCESKLSKNRKAGQDGGQVPAREGCKGRDPGSEQVLLVHVRRTVRSVVGSTTILAMRDKNGIAASCILGRNTLPSTRTSTSRSTIYSGPRTAS